MPLKVLVVEDETSNLLVITVGLRSLGHEVVSAMDPLEGLAIARDQQPDLIMMDLNFHGALIDGLEAIQLLKQEALTAHIPVLAQTASVLGETERLVIQNGAAGMLRKPYTRAQMATAITCVIAGEAVPCFRGARGGVHPSQPPLQGLT